MLPPLIHNWTKGQTKRRERRNVGASVPLCYTGCELLEVRAPGFQGQLSGDTGCELMLMKAAQACKQHGRMSLEYITIHNCLPRAGGLHMAQPQPQPPPSNQHTHASCGFLSPPGYLTGKADKRWNDSAKAQNNLVLVKWPKALHSAPFKPHTILWFFSSNSLFLSLHHNTPCTCALKIDTNCWKTAVTKWSS